MHACARRVVRPASAQACSAKSALLALAERRSDEQIEADQEIERISRDEPDELIRSYQDGVAAAGTFFDLWVRRNNLPAPPCPGCAARELLQTDLVAVETMRVATGRLRAARRQRVAVWVEALLW